MFGSKTTISVKIKLYGGLDRQSKIKHYDPDSGVDLQLAAGVRLKKVFKAIGLSRHESVVCFINGRKAGFSEKLKDNDSIFLMRAASGG